MKISAGGALLLAALYFFLPPAEFAALLLAAAAHEAGHILALRLCGARVISLRVTATGAVIERSAAGERGAEALCALAGAAAGLLYALAAARLGGETLTLSAGASAALSAFNALPARPLDGWRALEAVAGAPAARGRLAAVRVVRAALRACTGPGRVRAAAPPRRDGADALPAAARLKAEGLGKWARIVYTGLATLEKEVLLPMDKRLRRILPTVQKPARYTGGEYNEIIKDKRSVKLRMAFCFPDTYEIGIRRTWVCASSTAA